MKSLKFIIFVASHLFYINAFARNIYPTVTRCLGVEEYFIYKNKINGPIYKLNQNLIIYFSKKPSIFMPPELYQSFCGKITQASSPSLKILEHILANKEHNLLKISSADFIGIFFKFIDQVQQISPSATCLNNNIPYLKKFKDFIRYVGTDRNHSSIDLKKDEYHKLFTSLKDIHQIIKNCKVTLKNKSNKKI